MIDEISPREFSSDEEVLASVNKEFGGLPRPTRFTAEDGDPECMLHDAMWNRVTLETLTLEDVFPELSYPFNELLSEGVAYFLPAITRLVLDDKRTEDWSGVAFVDGVLCRLEPKDCNSQQASVVFGLMNYVISQNARIDDTEEIPKMERIALSWKRSFENAM